MILVPIAREAFLPFLIASFFAGIVCGAVYDLFRVRREAFRSSASEESGAAVSFWKRQVLRMDTMLTLGEDIVFSVFAAILLILITFKLYFGVPRWFAYAAAILGFGFYRVTVGRLVIRLAVAVLRLFCAVNRWLKQRVLLPLVRRGVRLLRGIGRQWRRAYARRDTHRYEAHLLSAVSRIPVLPNDIVSHNGRKDDRNE